MVAGTVAAAVSPDLAALVALVVLGLSAIGSAAIYAAPTIVRRLTGEGAIPGTAAFRAETAARSPRHPVPAPEPGPETAGSPDETRSAGGG